VAVEESKQQAAEVDDRTAEVALALFEHVEDQINRTDNKAQVVLAADAILLGWFSTLGPNLAQPLFAADATPTARATSLPAALIFLALFLSLASGLVVIWPRMATPRSGSLVYFGGIARRGEREFVAAFMRQSRAEVTEGLLREVHATAHIARRKFRWVGLSVGFLLLGLALLAVLGVLAALGAVHVALP
jgi:hypothetical protein